MFRWKIFYKIDDDWCEGARMNYCMTLSADSIVDALCAFRQRFGPRDNLEIVAVCKLGDFDRPEVNFDA